jgi:hypothetical protein
MSLEKHILNSGFLCVTLVHIKLSIFYVTLSATSGKTGIKKALPSLFVKA